MQPSVNIDKSMTYHRSKTTQGFISDGVCCLFTLHNAKLMVLFDNSFTYYVGHDTFTYIIFLFFLHNDIFLMYALCWIMYDFICNS